MKNENLYIFILRLALTFRLSLKNICKILGRDDSPETQKKIYKEIDGLFCKNLNLKRAYDYLFNYETINETDKLSVRALEISNIFLSKYRKVCKTGNKEEIQKVNSELEILDKKFKELQKRIDSASISEEDVMIISKYRLKYAMSMEHICDILRITRKSLALREERISNQVLKYKLDLLTDFYKDIFVSKRNVK